jgi:Pyruvate/2-oxoacid:ferredoxin oxidoreductase delta subunit
MFPLSPGKPARYRMDASTRIDPPRLLAVVTDACTGCEICLDFCPVDCIDPPAPAPGPSAPVVIRQAECIGCRLCANVCGHLRLNAIAMVPAH